MAILIYSGAAQALMRLPGFHPSPSVALPEEKCSHPCVEGHATNSFPLSEDREIVDPRRRTISIFGY